MVKHLPAIRETWVPSLGLEDALEKEMATHSSTLAWRIPWMEEPGRLQSMGSPRVGHNWATSLCFFFLGLRAQTRGTLSRAEAGLYPEVTLEVEGRLGVGAECTCSSLVGILGQVGLAQSRQQTPHSLAPGGWDAATAGGSLLSVSTPV